MLAPIYENKKKFEQKLLERYEAEFSKITVWNGHKEWWLNDVGIGHEERFYNTFSSIGKLIDGWRDKLCIELGCGSGASLVALEALGAKSIGLELEVEGEDLELAKLRAAMYEIVLDLVNADAIRAPFKECVFDIVLSLSVVEHVQDIKSYLMEAYRLLKPGGILFISTDNRCSIKEDHTGLYFFHWLPYKYFSKVANLKLSQKKDNHVRVYPRTYSYYHKFAKKIGFRLIATRWDIFLRKNSTINRGWKYMIAKYLKKTRIPIERILPGTTLVLKK